MLRHKAGKGYTIPEFFTLASDRVLELSTPPIYLPSTWLHQSCEHQIFDKSLFYLMTARYFMAH